MSRLPDFYVVGAPKCGTTSLHRYLRQHPGVFVPDVKEPNFFCSDFPSIQKYKSLEDYSMLFEPAQENQLVGEASPWYLYSKTAIQNILDVQPDAKFIVMLRNPVDAVISYYRYMRYYLVEDRNAILDAVLLEDWGGKAKIPAIGFGPGDEVTAHTVLDSVPLNDMVKAAEFYALLPSQISK